MFKEPARKQNQRDPMRLRLKRLPFLQWSFLRMFYDTVSTELLAKDEGADRRRDLDESILTKKDVSAPDETTTNTYLPSYTHTRLCRIACTVDYTYWAQCEYIKKPSSLTGFFERLRNNDIITRVRYIIRISTQYSNYQKFGFEQFNIALSHSYMVAKIYLRMNAVFKSILKQKLRVNGKDDESAHRQIDDMQKYFIRYIRTKQYDTPRGKVPYSTVEYANFFAYPTFMHAIIANCVNTTPVPAPPNYIVQSKSDGAKTIQLMTPTLSIDPTGTGTPLPDRGGLATPHFDREDAMYSIRSQGKVRVCCFDKRKSRYFRMEYLTSISRSIAGARTRPHTHRHRCIRLDRAPPTRRNASLRRKRTRHRAHNAAERTRPQRVQIKSRRMRRRSKRQPR